MSSPDACYWPLPHIQRYKDVAPPHPLHNDSDFSPPPQSAGWVSPPSPAIYSTLFSTRLLLRRPTLPHPARPATFLHTTTWLSFKREGAPSLLQHNRSFLPLPAGNNGTQSAAWKARESHSSSSSLKHQYILFHGSLLFVLIIEGSAWNRVALGFHGRRLWLMKRERLFVAFSWRRPALLLSTNCHQSCWKSSYFI